MYHALFGQFKKQLLQMDSWFDAAEAHAEAKRFDVNTLLVARLAPDQLPLVKQVQIACDAVKLGAARLGGKEAPKHDDSETTVAELRARVKDVAAYLEGFTEADFAQAAGRSITQPRWEGKTLSGADYFVEYVTPNFYFHTCHLYALLRHNGVNLGKRDYLGTLSYRAPS